MPPLKVRRDDERHLLAFLALPVLEPWLHPGFQARPIAVAPVQDAALLVEDDRIVQAVRADVLDQRVELLPL